MSSHTAQTELKLIGKLIVEGDIACQTGLHIGAGKGSLEIGGADNPVVKDAFGLPYIPGSSLRGRVRSLLENALGMATPAELVSLSTRRGTPGSRAIAGIGAAGIGRRRGWRENRKAREARQSRFARRWSRSSDH